MLSIPSWSDFNANGYDKDEADKLEQVMKYYPSVKIRPKWD